MSTQTVTCPACNKSLRSDRPLTPGTALRCPECRKPFTAPTPPEVEREPRRAALGPAFWAVSVASVILGGAIVTAAALMSTPRTPPPSADDDGGAKKTLADEQAKLDAERKALAADKARLDAARLVTRAKEAMNAGELADAERLYDEALKLAPADAEARSGLIDVRLAIKLKEKGDGDMGKKEAELERLLADAKAAMLEKKYATAIPLLEAVRGIAPTDAAVLKALAEANDGITADVAEKKKLEDYNARLDAAKAALAGGRFADAAREFAAARQVMPTAEAAAGLKQAEGRLAGEADLVKKQKQFDDLMADARAAEARLRLGEALDAVDRAARLMPDDKAARRLQGEVAAALKEVKSANGKRLARANAALAEGRFDDAAREAGEAARAWPEDKQAAKVLKQAEDAAESFRANQAKFALAIQAADIAYAAGRYGDAVVAYNEALTYQPLNADIQRALRNAVIARDRDVRNKVEYEKQLLAGKRALARGAWAEAAAAFKAAAKLLPLDLAAKEGLKQARYGQSMQDGQAAYQKKQKAAAVAAFQAALDEMPGDFKATRALELAKRLK